MSGALLAAEKVASFVALPMHWLSRIATPAVWLLTVSVRGMLRLLEEKGNLRHEIDGQRYVYLPTVPREKAQRTALGHLVRTFFDGSAEQVVNTLVEDSRLSPDELDRLARLLAQARQREK